MIERGGILQDSAWYLPIYLIYLSPLIHCWSTNTQWQHKKKQVSRLNCPCPEQSWHRNSQLWSAISASILPIEPEAHNQPIHRTPVNSLVMIFRFFGWNWSNDCTWKLTVQISALFGAVAVYPTLIAVGYCHCPHTTKVLEIDEISYTKA